MNTGPGGFSSAPVTKGILVVTAAASIFFQAATTTPHSHRPRPLPFPLSLAPFRSPGELCFGSLLLYYFRCFERHMGSSKYGAHAFVTTTAAWGLQQLLRMAGVAQPPPSGPFSLIFASFIPFFFDIPPFSTFTFFGFRMTDKVFVYLAGLQLLLSSGRRSLEAGLCGVAAGLLYRQNVLGVQRLRVPQPVGRAFQALFSWMGDIASSGALVFNARSSQWAGGPQAGGTEGVGAVPAAPRWQPLHQVAAAQAAAQQEGGGGQAPVPSAPPLPPPQEAVDQLVSMGFEAGMASQALQQTGNDLPAAIALLL